MATFATFTGPGGEPADRAAQREISALTTVTQGDLLYVGQVFRSRIRERTLNGVDVNGAPFAPYSTKGPYYFYPNRDSAAGRQARATAAKNRHARTGEIGVRTPTGIKYESYAAAKAAHGAATVNLYGMEQHTHMLDTLLVRCNGSEIGAEFEGLDFGSEFSAFEQDTPAQQLQLGFYGPEAERAQGNNEGAGRLPKREFFALNAEDLALGEKAIAQRMQIRAQQAGPYYSGPAAPQTTISPATGTDDFDIGI